MATRRRETLRTIGVALTVMLCGASVDAAMSAPVAGRARPSADSPSPQATPLTCGLPVAGSIAAGGQQNSYAFAGAVGDKVWLALLKTGGDAGFTPGLAVYAPSGVQIFWNSTTTGFDTLGTLTENGTYTATISDANGPGQAGTYKLGLDYLFPAAKRCNVGALGCGQAKTIAIDAVAQRRLHVFPANTGDSLTLTFARASGSSEFQPGLAVYTPSGIRVNVLGGDGVLQLDALTETGFYVAEVHDWPNLDATGTYTLRRDPVSPSSCWAVPEFTSVDRVRFAVGVSGLFSVTVSGNPVPTLTSAGALPGTVTFVDNGNGSATLSGTAGAVGTYPLTLTASNIFDTAAQPFTLGIVGPLAPFTDDPLVARSTRVKLVHLTELRAAINALRAFYSLTTFAWTDATPTAGVTVVMAAHLTELRTALNQVYVAAGRTPPTYTDPTVTSRVTVITAVHIEEIRSAVRALW